MNISLAIIFNEKTIPISSIWHAHSCLCKGSQSHLMHISSRPTFYKFSSKWIYNNVNMSLIYCANCWKIAHWFLNIFRAINGDRKGSKAMDAQNHWEKKNTLFLMQDSLASMPSEGKVGPHPSRIDIPSSPSQAPSLGARGT